MADEKTIIMPDSPSVSYPAFGGFGNGFGSFNSIADLSCYHRFHVRMGRMGWQRFRW